MKSFSLFCILFCAIAANSQSVKQDLTKNLSSPDRKAILEVLKQKLQPDLKLKPKMVVQLLTVKNGFAYFQGRVKDSNGKDIDFTKTVYKGEVEQQMFDGDGTTALLKKTGGKWKVLTYVIGPTDVAWACWWKQYKAPREIFDYAENCE